MKAWWKASFMGRLPLLAITLIGLAFSTYYALTNPPFESPDEPNHLALIEFIAVNGRMPQLTSRQEAKTQEGHQHPVYYFFGAAIDRLVTGDGILQVSLARNPMSLRYSNFSRFLHDQPNLVRGSDRAVFYLLRLCNCLFFGLLIWVTGLVASRFIPEPFALVAPAAVAFLPEMQFICSSISNDSLAFLTGGLALLAIVKARENGRWILAGACVSLAYLTKKSDIIWLIPLLLGLWPLDQKVWKRLGLAFVGLLPMLLWMARQQIVYGGFFGGASEELSTPDLIARKTLADPYFSGLFLNLTYVSFFAVFGWVTVGMPVWVFRVASLLYLPGSTGVFSAFKSRNRFLPVTTFVLVAANIGGFVLYNLTYQQPQGRLLFPAIAGIAILVAYGWALILGSVRPRVTNIVLGAVCLTMLAVDFTAAAVNTNFYQASAENTAQFLPLNAPGG